MKVLLSFVLAFTVVFLLNNFGSNAYAQELQCPEINMLTISGEKKFDDSDIACYYEVYMDLDGDGYTEEYGHAIIHLDWLPKSEHTRFETCFEFAQYYPPVADKIDSKTYYSYVEFESTWTESGEPPFSSSVQNAAIDLFRELENSGLALPCESDFEFDIDVPVFETVKQKDTVRIPVEVTLVKGEPKEVALSTTTFQESLGIYGWFEQDLVTPTQRIYLVVQTSCNTPPDNYQFYANGIATSDSASSTDMVTVTVESSSDCPSQNNQIGQTNISGSINESLDTAFDLTNQGKYQEAIPYYDNVLQQEPDNVNALYNKANTL